MLILQAGVPDLRVPQIPNDPSANRMIALGDWALKPPTRIFRPFPVSILASHTGKAFWDGLTPHHHWVYRPQPAGAQHELVRRPA